MNIYQNIQKNKRDSFIIMFLFIAIVVVISWTVGRYYGDGSEYILVTFATIYSFLSALITYYFSDKIVLGVSGAKELLPSQAPLVHDLVENVCISAGLPKPKIYFMEDSAMNAFATGRDPQNAVVCLTTGIMDGRLNKRELEGVIAHELSHIGNYDIRFMSLVSVLVGTVTLLSDWFTRGMLYGDRRRRNSEVPGALFLIGIALVFLSPLIAALIKLALSRSREYLADSTSALITRYPAGLASALRKLGADKEILEAANGATSHLFITSPTREGIGGMINNLFSTHPPIEERIRRLEMM